MRVSALRLFAASLLAATLSAAPDASQTAISTGIKWLAANQGADGGWGQDGAATSHATQGQRPETNRNDVANTASAVLALVHAGSTPNKGDHRTHIRRGVEFLLAQIEKSKDEGLAITDLQGTQIQNKLGPFIDTFLTSMLLSELDGQMGDPAANRRVRLGLEKCVRKIEANQMKDGSWNLSGGWAPILGTSMASRSLYQAKDKGLKVNEAAMDRIEFYTKKNATQIVAQAKSSPDAEKFTRTDGTSLGTGRGSGVGSGMGGGVYRSSGGGAVSAAGAGVALYDRAQTLEQLSRTAKDRQANAPAIAVIAREMASPQMVNGYGSMGGEEYFSYLNVSDSLRRVGGEPWEKWNREIKAKLVKLQNADGTWAGHHCITGRVAVTSAAILTLTAERQPQ